MIKQIIIQVYIPTNTFSKIEIIQEFKLKKEKKVVYLKSYYSKNNHSIAIPHAIAIKS